MGLGLPLSVAESSLETSLELERERFLESLDAYQRGLSDAPLLRKWSAGGAGVAAEAGVTAENAANEMTFVISTDDVDRHGDVIIPEGWVLDAYQRNPVFLWAHDYLRPVIGKAVLVWKERHGLLAKMEFAPTDFAQEVASLYRGNYQRGVSVGFKPIRYEERRNEQTGAFQGIRFLEQELLEVSAVPVPANRSALRRSGDDLRLAGVLPQLEACVDDLSKLAGELSELVMAIGSGSTRDSGDAAITQMLSALRGAQW